MKDIVVSVKQGQLRGTTFNDANGRKQYAFLGIPYAKPIIGGLRFRAPQPIGPWKGVRNATKEGSPSKGRDSTTFAVQGEEENCLVLNVYTPQLSKEGQGLPVMVWIHGGGFTTGSSGADTYGPDYILTEDVVFVSLNYRLGIFGFLAFEDPSLNIPGNAAMKDMVLALQWVHENISQFGGDPERVTIFGESAGAAAVHLLTLSPLTKGLIHRAILQSGCVLNTYSIGKVNSHVIADALGIRGASEKEILEELNRKTTDELFELQEKVPVAITGGSINPFVVVLEKPSPTAFISEHPMDIVSSGNYNKVPMIVCYTSRECIMLSIGRMKQITEKLLQDFDNSALPSFLNDSNDKKKVLGEIKNFYFGSSVLPGSNSDSVIQLLDDIFFTRGLYRTVQLHRATSDQQIYFCRFSVDGQLNFYKHVFHHKASGCCHGDDLGYIFKSIWNQSVLPSSFENVIRKSVVRLWTNFAKSGNPNDLQRDDLIEIEWKPVTKDELHFLDIGENLTVGVDPNRVRMDFWDKLVKEYSVDKRY